jgi:hypothetical protein
MRRPPLQDIINQQMPWLFTQLGFEKVSSVVGGAFDHALFEVQNSKLRIRFLRDRSPTLAEFAPGSDPGFWIDLDVILDRILDEPTDLSVEGLAPVLHRRLQDIERALTVDLAQTKDKIARWEAEQRQSLKSSRVKPSRPGS